ncbi:MULTISPECIES: hypothetical protein [unclassified Pseudofrankia]|uniref:hypothetical protein n=1 Tax=unclassified Pseudofrankia TaxID=2994372 RepID=UPI0008D9155E|nr:MULTISPECIES: hypothetical protein [unclassified Pseudofrankia]MDT3438819.1 hypothetical protein [Pseudofrankia sp. BMG5.37]OHV75198.1 hypothetical protein BCD48_00200 [Pseudofrankia sp. BMG5.36]
MLWRGSKRRAGCDQARHGLASRTGRFWIITLRACPEGYVERLPSSSFRIRAYAGVDPLTGKEVYLKETVKRAETVEPAKQRLLASAEAGKRPENAATVKHLVAEYLATADIEPTTRHMYAGVDLRTTAGLLGHGSGGATLRVYAHRTTEADRRAATVPPPSSSWSTGFL